MLLAFKSPQLLFLCYALKYFAMLSSFCVHANAVGPSIWSQIEIGFLVSKAFMKCVGLFEKMLREGYRLQIPSRAREKRCVGFRFRFAPASGKYYPVSISAQGLKQPLQYLFLALCDHTIVQFNLCFETYISIGQSK
jgi:hypothetical protein